jgi:hypothetical protein
MISPFVRNSHLDLPVSVSQVPDAIRPSWLTNSLRLPTVMSPLRGLRWAEQEPTLTGHWRQGRLQDMRSSLGFLFLWGERFWLTDFFLLSVKQIRVVNALIH